MGAAMMTMNRSGQIQPSHWEHTYIDPAGKLRDVPFWLNQHRSGAESGRTEYWRLPNERPFVVLRANHCTRVDRSRRGGWRSPVRSAAEETPTGRMSYGK